MIYTWGCLSCGFRHADTNVASGNLALIAHHCERTREPSDRDLVVVDTRPPEGVPADA